MRAFIAIELSQEAKDELKRIVSALKKADADVKWVEPDTIHLTLKFLGDISEEKARVISEKLKEVVSSFRPFQAAIRDIGVFPQWDHAKVIWVGIDDGSDRVAALASKVEEAMGSIGFAVEKREFKPHVTIGRVRSPKNREQLRSAAETLIIEPFPSDICSLTLFKSELTHAGAIHNPIAILDFS